MPDSRQKIRLDSLLVERGFFEDCGEALRAVLAREVRIGDEYPTSAAKLVDMDADIQVKQPNRFVSRGGHKLQAALDAFAQNVKGLRCLDAGASTGGFTDCLLQAGAAQVVCVDVGYGQLDWSLRNDSRVKVHERTNIRKASPEKIGAPFDIIVADLSFIGLAKLAPKFAEFAKPGTVFLGLVKPQFESRRGETEGGVVLDESVRVRTVEEVSESLEHAGFSVEGVIESPVKGPAGNIEYLIRAAFRADH